MKSLLFFFIISISTFSSVLFYESFESEASIIVNGGDYSPLNIVAGKTGNGVYIGSGDTLQFPATNKIDTAKGTIDFWIKPNWGSSNHSPYKFFSCVLGDITIELFKWYSSSDNFSYFVYKIKDSNSTITEVSSSYAEPNVLNKWVQNEWQHVQIFWDYTRKYPIMGYRINDFYINIERRDIPPFNSTTAFFKLGAIDNIQQPNAVIDELKILDYAIIDSLSHEDLNLETCGDGVWDNTENFYNCSDDALILDSVINASKNVMFFSTAPFEAVYEGTVPAADKIISTSSVVSVTPNEYESIFINVYSRVDLGNSKCVFTGFPNGICDSFDLRVVKNWLQDGYYAYRADLQTFYVPELLLYADTLNLKSQTWGYKNLPSFPKLDTVISRIQPYTSKQFVLTVHVDSLASAGQYSGKVIIIPESSPAETLEVILEVLPFRLRNHNRIFGTYYRGSIDSSKWVAEDSIGATRVKTQIKDMAAHGLNSVMFNPSEILFSNDSQKVEWAIENGINKMIVLSGLTTQKKEFLESKGLDPYFYGVDEPYIRNIMNEQLSASRNIHSIGGKVITGISRTGAEILIDSGEALDHEISSNYRSDGVTFFDSLAQISNNFLSNTSYYWQSMRENPRVNRGNNGFYLWNTGAAGTMPYVYQHVTNNPYDDFDEWDGVFRDHLTVYPSQEGPVPTIQWEGYREGIDDLKYLTTWKYYRDSLSSINPSYAMASDTVIMNLLDNYKVLINLENVSAQQYSSDRKLIISEILKLRSYIISAKIENLEKIPIFSFEVSPNPFNPSLNINFSSSKVIPEAIKIFDINGKLIVNLSNKISPSGIVKWNATSKRSGVYWVWIKAGNKTIVKQVTLLK